jgi:cell division protein ZapB
MDISQIEEKIRMLIEKCQHLESENSELREKVSKVEQTCQSLQNKNQNAISSVEEMIGRLRVLEE